LRAPSDDGLACALVPARFFLEELTNSDARIGCYARRDVTRVANPNEPDLEFANIMPVAF
jgi:hypothetical protein